MLRCQLSFPYLFLLQRPLQTPLMICQRSLETPLTSMEGLQRAENPTEEYPKVSSETLMGEGVPRSQKTPEIRIRVRGKRRFVAKIAPKVRLLQN
jgi:hypothetical protein